MASRDKADVDTFHKCIQHALEKLGKSTSGFERTVVSKFKIKRRVGSGNELVGYSRAPCLGADQKARGLWERDWSTTHNNSCCACASRVKNEIIFKFCVWAGDSIKLHIFSQQKLNTSIRQTLTQEF